MPPRVKRKADCDSPEDPSQRKKASKAKQSGEKRLGVDGKTVRFAKSPSQKIQDRIARALPGSGHRMFLVDRKTIAPSGSEGGPVEEFAVLGATANVYKVRVGKHPYCSCPDSAVKGNMCKHYLYVMIRVLRLAQDDPLVWQKALLSTEAAEVLAGARSKRSSEEGGVMAAADVCAEYRRMAGAAAGDAQAPAPASGRPVEGDCPVCYDDMQPGGTTPSTRVVTCESCGNHVHQECFQQWSAQKKASMQEVTCVYCRCTWPEPQSASTGAGGAYINLKALSTEHGAADTSLSNLYGERAQWIGFHSRR